MDFQHAYGVGRALRQVEMLCCAAVTLHGVGWSGWRHHDMMAWVVYSQSLEQAVCSCVEFDPRNC